MSYRLNEIGKTHRNVGATMINAAMVGLGRWGQTVLGSIQGKSDRIRIVHGVTKEPELARELAAKHGFRLSTDLKDAIADPEVQAILLATPHSLHVEQVRMVAAAGKPVWCEKPLALTRAQAEIAVAAVKAAGVPFGTGNNKRCFASMRELKRVVESGAIGKVMHIEGHFSNEHSTRVSGGWRDDPKESPGAGMTGAGLARARCLCQPRRADRLRRRALDLEKGAARSARRCRRAHRIRKRRHRADGDGPRHAGLLALRRVRYRRLRRSQRRGPARPSPRSAVRRKCRRFRTSIRCACCWKPSPTPSRARRRSRCGRIRCSI